jgi:catalase
MSVFSTVKHAFDNILDTTKIKDLTADTVHVTPASGLTTDHGVKVSDTDNWYVWLSMIKRRAYPHRLKVTDGIHAGPSLLEDQISREKIHRFDHERIPERVVHARGAGAHGYFRLLNDSAKKWTKAGVLTDTSRTTPVFVRFSTVQGSKGSAVSSYP